VRVRLDAERCTTPVEARVQVDPTWRDDEAARIYYVACAECDEIGADRGDPLATNADIGDGVQVPCRIDHATTANDQIEHGAR